MYGQTGSGKTHTISCRDKGNLGIIPRAVNYIFDTIEKQPENEFVITINYIQIYMEMVCIV
jgi:hypothetical protein